MKTWLHTHYGVIMIVAVYALAVITVLALAW